MPSQPKDSEPSTRQGTPLSPRERRKLRGVFAAKSVTRRIVDRLALGPASSAEIASALSLPVVTVRLEVKKLARAGVVYRNGKTRRRGNFEHLYSLDLKQMVLRPGEMSYFADDQIAVARARLLRQMHDEAMEAIEARSFYARDEFALTRLAIPLDDRGWVAAQEVHRDLGHSIVDVVEEAKARIADEDETDAFPICANVLFFEAPLPWPSPLAGDGEASKSTRRAPRGDRLVALSALGDPLRRKILDALSLGPTGVGELGERLGISREKVRYELGRLREMDVVEVHSRRRRRGMEELLYVCQNRKLVVGADEVSKFDPLVVDRFCRVAVAEIFRDGLAAMKGETLRGKEDSGFARVPGRIDCKAFNEVSALISAALDRLLEIREECMKRLAGAGEPPRAAISGLLLFERPPS